MCRKRPHTSLRLVVAPLQDSKKIDDETLFPQIDGCVRALDSCKLYRVVRFVLSLFR